MGGEAATSRTALLLIRNLEKWKMNIFAAQRLAQLEVWHVWVCYHRSGTKKSFICLCQHLWPHCSTSPAGCYYWFINTDERNCESQATGERCRIISNNNIPPWIIYAPEVKLMILWYLMNTCWSQAPMLSHVVCRGRNCRWSSWPFSFLFSCLCVHACVCVCVWSVFIAGTVACVYAAYVIGHTLQTPEKRQTFGPIKVDAWNRGISSASVPGL